MKAMAINRHGDCDVFEAVELPLPNIGNRDLLVKVLFSSINPLDCRIRSFSDYPRGFPLILGYDVCGIVEKVGRLVTSIKVGDTIAASPNVFMPGANAEYVVVDSRTAAKLPANLKPELAGVIPLAGITAWECLYDRAKIRRDQTLLIHAGAGGVGHLAIQLAKNSGCNVIATASRAESLELCKKLGAELVVNYKTQDFVAEVLNHTSQRGCDAIFDFVGEDVLNESLKCAKINGQIVTITPSRILKLGPDLLMKNLTIHYEFMGVANAFGINIKSQGAKLQKLIDMANIGLITPYIKHRFPITQIAKAHEIQESGCSLGKILITNEEWL